MPVIVPKFLGVKRCGVDNVIVRRPVQGGFDFAGDPPHDAGELFDAGIFDVFVMA